MTSDAPSFVPKSRPAADMARRIAEQAVARRRAADARKREVPTNAAWVLGCPMNPREHVGILFGSDVDPRSLQEIHGGMWFSSYHDMDDPFWGGREQVVCSSCLVERGERVVLKVEMVQPSSPDIGSTFRIPPHFHRFLRLMGSEELKAYLGTPEPATPAAPPAPAPTTASAAQKGGRS